MRGQGCGPGWWWKGTRLAEEPLTLEGALGVLCVFVLTRDSGPLNAKEVTEADVDEAFLHEIASMLRRRNRKSRILQYCDYWLSVEEKSLFWKKNLSQIRDASCVVHLSNTSLFHRSGLGRSERVGRTAECHGVGSFRLPSWPVGGSRGAGFGRREAAGVGQP